MLRIVNFWFALLGLGSNKLRSALTTLGVIIGVGAVIVIVSLGNGLRRSTEQEMEAFSNGLIEVRYMGGRYGGVMYESAAMAEMAIKGGGNLQPQQPQYLSIRDVQALKELATSTDGVMGLVETYGEIVYQGQRVPIGQITGVSPEYLAIYRQELASGRFFTEHDSRDFAPVAVVAQGLVEEFLGKGVDPVGKIMHVTVNNVTQNFEIIGVIQSPGANMGWGRHPIVVPLQTAQVRLMNRTTESLDSIVARVDARDRASRQFALAQMNTILRARRGLTPGVPEDYSIYDTMGFSEESERIIMLLTLILSLIAGISLVVGSIGLMNIMLVSVSERTYEIGLRRAMGARRGDVLAQFLAEAAMLSLIGGLLGLGLGIGGSYGISLAVEQLTGMVSVTWDVILIALGISIVVGVASGLYPAWRAARLHPSEALRHG